MTSTAAPAEPLGRAPSGEAVEVAVLDRDGVIIAVNDGWVDFCRRNGGEPARSGVGRSYLEVCDAVAGDPSADAVARALRAALDGRPPAPETVVIPCHTLDARRWYRVHVSPRLDDAGDRIGAMVVIEREDTARSAAALAVGPRLGMPSGDLLDVLDLVPDPVLVLDRRLTVLHANLTAAAWLGYSPDHLAGLSVQDLNPGADPATHAHVVAGLDRDARAPVTRRCEFRSRDGERRPAEVHVHLAGGPGDAARLVLVARDVRALEAREHLRSRQVALATRMAEVTTELLDGRAPEDVYDDFAVTAAEVTAADDAAVVLPGPDGRLRRVAVVGEAAQLLEDEGVPFSSAVAAAVLGRGRGVTFGPIADVEPRVRSFMGSIAASPVVVAQRAHGLIAVSRRPGRPDFGDEDLDLLDRLAVQLGLVIQMVRGRSARQRLAVLQDRQRIARDLHDTVIQDLIGLGMHVHAEANHEVDDSRRSRDEDLVDHLDRVVRRLRAAVFQLRDQSPGATLTETVESLVAEAARALDHVPSLHLAGAVDDLPPILADEVVPVLREALSNVARHAAATATSVALVVDGGRVRIVVEDDGRGPASGGHGGTGLANLRERAAAMGGDAGLDRRDGGGARLWWECPVVGDPRDAAVLVDPAEPDL